LFGVDVKTVLEVFAPDASDHIIDIKRRTRGADRQRVAVVAGIAAIAEDTKPQFAGLIEDRVTLLKFDNS